MTTQREQRPPTHRRRQMFRPIRAVFHDPEGKVILASVATLLAVGTIVYSVLEHWSLLDSLYFSVVTLATVGYGDLHPTTDLAKVFTIGYILTGIGIVAAFASEVAKHRVPPGAVPGVEPPTTGSQPVDTESAASAADPTSAR